MFELVATSEKTADGWRHKLQDGETIRVGRAPADGLRIPWDMRISREQADITLRGDRLEIETVSTAKNAAVYNGMKLRQLNVGIGEVFNIGRTQFCLEAVPGKADKPHDAGPAPGSSAAALHDEIARLKAKRQQERAFISTVDRTDSKAAEDELNDLRAQIEAAKRRRAGLESPAEDAPETTPSASLSQDDARDVRPPLKPRPADDEEQETPGEEEDLSPPAETSKHPPVRKAAKEPDDAGNGSGSEEVDFDKKQTRLPGKASELKRQLEELERRRNADSATDSEKLTDSQYDYVHQLLLQLHQVEKQAVETDSVEAAQDEIKGLQSRIADAADKIAELESVSEFEPRDVSGSQQIGYASNDIRRRARQHRKRLEGEGKQLSRSDQLTGSEAEILKKLEKKRAPAESSADDPAAINATAPDIVFTQQMAEAALNPEEPSPLLKTDVRPHLIADSSATPDDPPAVAPENSQAGKLLPLLPEAVQDIVLAIAGGAAISQQDQETLAAALTTALEQNSEGDAAVATPLAQLAARFPQMVSKQRAEGAAGGGSLEYVRRGEWFGVNEVLRGGVYQATLRGYTPPATQNLLTASPTFVMKAPAAALAGLRSRSPANKRPDQPWLQPLPDSLRDPSTSEDNWSGAQNLLLIDLDRCTKCGDCVEVCGEVHADNLSRLTLQGPTTGQQWAVQNCRACLDPQCLAGCPVNAIEQLAGGRVEINDWCIGCGLCEQQCPYDAVHIYDNAIISNGSSNWHVAPLGAAPGSRWRQLDFDDSRWLPATGPFFWSEQLRSSLAMQWPEPPAGGRTPELCFRAAFAITAAEREQRLTLKIRTSGELQVWLNGVKLEMVGREIAGEGFPLLWETNIDRRLLQTGDNICSMLAPFGKEDEPLLWARLSASPRHSSNLPAEAALLAPPSQSAVVCDLCHHRDGGPACISECPETALFRFDGAS